MAKRSDFAQKLLDDLRLRKERMAASQSSNKTKPAVSDAYAHSKQNYRGTREPKRSGTQTGLRNGSAQNRTSGGNKSVTTREASTQMVPFGRGQSSKQIGDLSMVLAFALENGGKLGRMDSSGNTSILGFLNQFGRSSDNKKVGMRNSVDRHRPTSSRLPTLSHFHVEEISRGAQKLNQILRACSNGLNIDGYSIEIGKELFKGAIDLEESLRVLVNLQEGSDVINPQRKSRITLLEEDEDEDDIVNIDEQKQLDRPQFSFDKRSRNYHGIREVARNDIQLRLAALTYPSEATNFIYKKQSGSSGSDVKALAAFSEQKNQESSSQAKQEKARIPNVIAKLMGLTELPENVDSKYTTQKDSSSKKKVEEKKTVQGSTKKAIKRTENTENMAPQTVKQKVIQPNKIAPVKNIVVVQAERDLATHNSSFEVVIHDVKQPWKDLEGRKPITDFKKANIKGDEQQSSITQLNHKVGSLKEIQENHREQKRSEKSKTREPVLKNELNLMVMPPKTHKKSEAAVMFQEKTVFKEGVFQTENFYTNKLLAGTREKSQNNLGLQQPQVLQKSKPPEEKHQAEEREHQSRKQKLTISRHNEDLAESRNSTNLNINTKASMSKSSNQNTSPRDLRSKLAKSKASIPPLMQKKPVHEPEACKAESIKVHKRGAPPKINEVMIRRSRTLQNSARPMKHENSISQEVKHRWSDKLSGPKEAYQVRASESKETELGIIKSNEMIATVQPSTVAQQFQEEAHQASNLHSPVQDESQGLKEPQTLASNDSCQQGQDHVLGGIEELKSDDIIESNPPDGTCQGSSDISSQQLEYQKLSIPETPEPLTESENHLKHLLIKSQICLNTAEALFKLNIPYDILDASNHDYQDEESKLILDCGYEVMKRKGRRLELCVHPFSKVSSNSTMKIRSLDDLVKQLCKDFEKLKFYGGRNGNTAVLVEDYLPMMLHIDLYNKEPDVNSMWDLSWNEMMFALTEKDDVIRDVERFVLNVLLDEITCDLLPVQSF